MNNQWPDDSFIQRYLAGALNEDELDEIEARILEDPALLSHVEAEFALRESLRSAESELVQSRTDEASSVWDRINALVSTPAWSWAASGFACLALVVALLPAGADQYRLIDNVVFVGDVRSDSAPVVRVNADDRVVLAIDAIAWERAGPVSVRIVGGDRTIAFEAQSVSDDLQLFVPAVDLPRGDYDLVITGAGIERNYTLLSR